MREGHPARWTQAREKIATWAAGARDVLAEELARASGRHEAAFGAYEDRIRELVRRSRSIGPASMKALIPGSDAGPPRTQAHAPRSR